MSVDITPPQVSVDANPSIVDVGHPVVLTAHASDNVGVNAITLTVNGIAVPLDGSRQAMFTPQASGFYTATVEASDAAGNTSHAKTLFRARSAIDNGPPTVALTGPVGDSIITVPVTLTGTATEADSIIYDLQAAPSGTTTFTTFFEGYSAVSAGALGTLNPGAFMPSSYDVRVCGEDTRGARTCTTPLRYDLNPGVPRPGVTHLQFHDGQVNVTGLPIVVNRVYDSRDKTSGDFGIGWQLDASALALRESHVIGDGWEVQTVQGFFTTYELLPTKDHRVSITLPDGTTEYFRMRPDPQTQQLEPITFLRGAIYDPLPGTQGTLTPGNQPSFINPSDAGPTQIFDDNSNLYNPLSYVLTLPDGRQFTFTRTGSPSALDYALTGLKDGSGNTLTFGPTGIVASSGPRVGFARDSQGRITAITNADGATRTYSYNAAGDLVSATDYAGYTTQYRYDGAHNLMQIVDPRGNVPGTLIYDDQGRVSTVIDAQGRRVTVTHDDANRQDVVTDRLGHTTVTTYDERGNVASLIDALGNRTSYTYDAHSHMTSVTDPLSNTVHMAYDDAGNLLSYTDALGNTSTYAYDTNRHLTSEADPLGRATTYEYDVAGHRTAIVSPRGGYVRLRYDAGGNLTTSTDPTGDTAAFTTTTTASGQQFNYADPLGRSGSVAMRSDGQVTGEQFQANGQTVRYQYQYDANGILTGQTLPNGASSSLGLDAAGLPISTTDNLGDAQHLGYDNSGGVISFTDYNGKTAHIQRDAENQITSIVQADGAIITRTLDSLGRPTTVRLPDGSQLHSSFDAAGRVSSDGTGSAGTTTYTYDANGRATQKIASDGGQTGYAYDAAGQLISTTDPLSATTAMTYDTDGNLSGMTLPNGGTTAMQYDLSDRLTRTQDERGATMGYGYDAASQLTAITDTAGGVTSYQHDDLGDLSSATTPGGNTWGFTYDTLGQQASRTTPWGTTESYARDNAGRMTAFTNGAGATTSFGFDPMGHQTARTHDGATEVYTYTAGGRLSTASDSSGATHYTYDAGGRVARVDNPDGTFIAYTYDVAGRLASIQTEGGTTSYTYDGEGRMTGVSDSQVGTTSYTYDLAGRVIRAMLPDGSTTTYARSVRGWITHLHTVAANGTTVLRDEIMSYDVAGNLVQDTEPGRTQGYSYDAAGRVSSEARTGADAGNLGYGYDADWNLTTIGSRTLSYDRMRLTGDNIWSNYTYDGAGRPLTRSQGSLTEHFSYDALGRLVRLQRTGAGSGGAPQTVDLQYNYVGLVRRIVADGRARNLVWSTDQPVPQVLEERADDGTLLRRYVRGLGPVGIVDAHGVRVLHQDMSGSIRLVTSASGAVVSNYAYSAYGDATLGGSDTTSALRYDGEYFVPELGLYFLRARFYDPQDGRFLTPDLLPANDRLPQSFNPYLYASDNPVRFDDPLGAFSVAEIGIGLSIISVLASIAVTIFPRPLVYVAKALGFRTTTPTGVQYQPVGLSLDLTLSKGLGTGGLQFDYVHGKTKELGIAWFFLGVQASTSSAELLGTPQFTVWGGVTLGDNINSDVSDPGAGVYLAVSGTVARALLDFSKAPSFEVRQQEYERGSFSIQWELIGTDKNAVDQGTVQGYTIYGSLFGKGFGAFEYAGNIQRRNQWSAGISLTLYIPIFFVYYDHSPANSGSFSFGGPINSLLSNTL